MNLHAIVRGAITTVNPDIPGVALASTGYVTLPDGTRRPTFEAVDIRAQVQALSFQDIQLIDGLGINGERRAIWADGRFDSLNRPLGTGSDILAFKGFGSWPFGSYWKVALNAEQWPDWCHLVCTLQMGQPTFITAHSDAGILIVGAVSGAPIKSGMMLLGQWAVAGSVVGAQLSGAAGGIGTYAITPAQELDLGDYVLTEFA